MKKLTLAALVLPLGIPQAAPAQTVTSSLLGPFEITKDNIMASAQMLDEEMYAFRPTDEVRSVGELFGHIANAQYTFCAAAAGESSPATENFEETRTTKAGLIEALEMGSRLLLIDEDTSATNFMSRDRRMQELVPAAGEPITPMVDRIEELRDDLGVSTIVVVGGTGDYLDVADLVLRMDGFRPSDVTRQARDTAALVPTGRTTEVRRPLELGPVRTIDRTSVNPARGRRAVHVKAPDERTLLFGREIIDVQALEQVVGRGQLQAIGLVLASVVRSGPGDRVIDVREAIEEALREGLDSFDDRRTGDLMACRSYEAIAVLNRLRTLRVR